MSMDGVHNMLVSSQNLTWRGPPRCPKCHQSYTASYVKQGTSRRAFILKCDHMMCERCIRDQYHRREVVCRICNIRTLLEPKKPLFEQLQHSFQMLGFVNQRQYEISRLNNSGLSLSSFSPEAPGIESNKLFASIKQEHDDAESDPAKECAECNITTTRYFCKECDSPLCRDCFEKIHQIHKVLSKHKLCSLTARRLIQEDYGICEEHKLATGLFCTNCESTVCARCRDEGKHAGHLCVTVEELNRKDHVRLEGLIREMEQALAVNELGKKNLELVQEQQQKYADKTVSDITDYFFSLHNVLQSVENELLLTVKNTYQKMHKEVIDSAKQLATAERSLYRSIDQLKTFQVALPRQTLLSEIIKEMNEQLHTMQITDSVKRTNENPFRFQEREPLRKEIHKYFELYCNPFGYCHKMTTFYQPSSLLEPIESPEPQNLDSLAVVPTISMPTISSDLANTSNISDHSLGADMDISSSPPPSAAATLPETTVKPKLNIVELVRTKDNKYKGDTGRVRNLHHDSILPPGCERISVSPEVEFVPNPSPSSVRPNSVASKGQAPSSQKSLSRRVSQGRLNSKSSVTTIHSSPRSPAVEAAAGAANSVAKETRKPEMEINPINPDNATFIKYSQKVNVTCVESPGKFYVQNQCFKSIVNELCQDEGESASEPDQIAIGELYLVHPSSETKWYRAKVLSRSRHSKKYRVMFIDYGRTEEVTSAQIRDLSEELREFEAGAYECMLYDLIPVSGKKWTPEARQIMIDFIDNKQMIMYLVENDENSKYPMHVDLFSQTVDSPKSLRGALVYLNLAKVDPSPERRSEIAIRKIDQLEKTLTKWSSEYKRRFTAPELERDDVFKVHLTYSVSPSEFYISKTTWSIQTQKLQSELTQYCNKEAKVAYHPHVGMVCAFVERDAYDQQTWRRGLVVKVGEAHCEILSVDTGHKLIITWQDIRYLPKQFCQQPELAVRCKLMDITPFKQHNYRWTDETIREFNRIANVPSAFQVFVGSRDVIDRCYEVALYMVKKKHDVCVNALMVKNGFAVSTGRESLMVEHIKDVMEEPTPKLDLTVASGSGQNSNRSKGNSSEKKQTRARVELLRIVSPGEFYVTLIKNASGIDRMQEEIQNKMEDKMDEGDDKTIWNIDELCLVFPTAVLGNERISCEWYRARVIEIVDSSNYTVFLIDKAFTMCVHYTNMCVIPPGLKQVHPAAIRCFLACVVPTANQTTWSPSVIDAFKVAIDKFEGFAISLHGRSIENSLPVILWGLTASNANALSPHMFDYTNINNTLVKYGYVHLKEKFQPLASAGSVEDELARLTQAFDRFIEELDVVMEEKSEEPSISNSCELYKEELSTEPTPIEQWLPAKPIDKNIFVAVATYVDNNGVIYLHDVEREPFLTAMRKIINDKYGDSQPVSGHKFFANGEPCLARFHLDNHFYRAVVRKAISPIRYKVQFVDYGNIEECNFEELRKEVICGKVPTMVNRYRLSDVAPLGDKGIWDIEVLDAMHSLIVGKQCQVRVDTDMDYSNTDVVPCFLKVTGEVTIDVSDYLLRHKLVAKKREIFAEKVDILYDPHSNLQEGSSEAAKGKPSSRLRIAANFGTESTNTNSGSEEAGVKPKSSEASNQDLEDLLQRVAAEQDPDAEEFEDTSGIDLNKVQYFCSYQDIKLEMESDPEDGELSEEERKTAEDGTENGSNLSFNPNDFDTSTQIDPPLEMTRPTVNGFPQFEVDETISGFYCEVTNLIDPFNLYVFPLMDDHVKRMKELMAKIQCYARKHRTCSDIEEKMPCLALFKQDNFWYRGLIEEYIPNRGEVRIFYVDYLNKETVSVRDILKCPVNLRRVPLRNVQVKLHALKANSRLREPDIMRKLVELIEGKRIYVKVIRHTLIPEVELYTDAKCTSLIYQQMLKEKYFLPGSEAPSKAPTDFSSSFLK
ncbi:tudor domain-containing protein 6 [Uranotaenia lowii]|uniref:tudor domain-containing protein 6 n=1 Tax=Uranotaenia lowii TaxID=190385 RepID=UPI0024784E94|nr:tudor domain-containing protein 6 [Uranotaenia lowii]